MRYPGSLPSACRALVVGALILTACSPKAPGPATITGGSGGAGAGGGSGGSGPFTGGTGGIVGSGGTAATIGGGGGSSSSTGGMSTGGSPGATGGTRGLSTDGGRDAQADLAGAEVPKADAASEAAGGSGVDSGVLDPGTAGDGDFSIAAPYRPGPSSRWPRAFRGAGSTRSRSARA